MLNREENFKNLKYIYILAGTGIPAGIVVAIVTKSNIGIGILGGWAVGNLIGSVIALVLSKIDQNKYGK